MRSLRLALIFPFLLPSLATTTAAKENWQSEMVKWAVSNDTNPNCNVRFTVGMYRPDMGDKPAWGMMTEKMFKWFSKEGVKLAPSVCPVSRATKELAAYRILFSVSPMKIVSQTTHGSETQTVNQPFNASVNSRTSYSDGSTANSTATINGQQATTVVVPTETTISQSSVDVYMYTYRVSGEQLELIGSDSVVFSRVAASGSGENATGAELGAGIGNLIRASGDRHRADRLYEEALKAILADMQDTPAKPAVSQISVPAASARSASAQASPNAASLTPLQSADTPKERAAIDDAGTQFDLGAMYETGRGVPQDYAQAVLWYRKAAEQGYAKAEWRLGVLYVNGHGVPQDKVRSAELLLSAAKQGYSPAYELIGGAYLTGDGMPIDYAEASFWLSVATVTETEATVSQGDAMQLKIAAMYLSPSDLARVEERAREWLKDHPAK